MEETGIEHTETCAAIELPDDNVELIRLDHKIIFLVGTAHISKKSAELVSDVIEQVRPDSVAVELCHSRYQSLKDPDRWKNMDIVSVIREGRAYVLVAHLLLASFQKKLGDQLDIKPGIEMLKAVEAAEKAGAETVLADRDVRITLKRIWASLDIWSMSKLIATMLGATISDTKIDEAEIERLKSADALEEAMREFSESLPKVRTALIDERDKYL
ncbi:MAG: TraB family protein, partial [Candidatus Dadabacteria bacterium]